MRLSKITVVVLICVATAAPGSQRKKKGYDGGAPPWEVSTKTQKKAPEKDQVLPLPKEPPAAVEAETARVSFHVSPLSAKGLLSQQTRDALHALIRASRGPIVDLRAFVAGSGDLRRVPEIAAEVFGERHAPLPAVAVILAGGLPLEGAQILLEAVEVDRNPLNPKGLGFLAGQPAASLDASIQQLSSALAREKLSGADVLRTTCFVSSLEADPSASATLQAAFPNAASSLVQMTRLPVQPSYDCEAVARLKEDSPSETAKAATAAGQARYAHYTQVTAPKLVFTSLQLAFGSDPADLQQALDRLSKALAPWNAKKDTMLMMHEYVSAGTPLKKIRSFTAAPTTNRPAGTLIPIEGLPSLDATYAVDAIAYESPTDGTR